MRHLYFAVACGLALLTSVPGVGVSARETASVQAIYAHARDSVVLLIGYDKNGQPLTLGSGFFVRNDVLATNLHVVVGASAVKVKYMSGELLAVKNVVGVDPGHDVVLLESPMQKPALSLHLETPEIGEPIIAIGNPLGLQGTVSTGIVSGIRKDKESIYYQITAPISPGSSGGPIINASGEVIGVSTFTIIESQNLNFAVPALYLDSLLRSPKKMPMTSTMNLTKSKIVRAANERVTVKSPYINGGPMDAGIEASIVNQTDNDIKNVRIVAVFYAAKDKSNPVDYLEILVKDTIPSHLAKRFSRSNHDLYEHGWDLFGERGRWAVDFRVLDYEIVRHATEELGIPQ